MAETGETAPTLVVGHSQDPSSDYALAAAVDLARRVGGRLHVVHVVETKDYPVDSDAADWEQQGAAVIAEQRRRVEARLSLDPQMNCVGQRRVNEESAS